MIGTYLFIKGKYIIMSDLIKNIKGTQDILYEENDTWQYLENFIHHYFKKYGYSQIRTPIFESTYLFSEVYWFTN